MDSAHCPEPPAYANGIVSWLASTASSAASRIASGAAQLHPVSLDLNSDILQTIHAFWGVKTSPGLAVALVTGLESVFIKRELALLQGWLQEIELDQEVNFTLAQCRTLVV